MSKITENKEIQKFIKDNYLTMTDLVSYFVQRLSKSELYAGRAYCNITE